MFMTTYFTAVIACILHVITCILRVMTCILGCIYRSIRTVRMANVGSGPAGVCRRRRSTTRVTTREPTGMFSFVLWELLSHTTDHPQNHLDCFELFLRLFVNFHVLLFITLCSEVDTAS